MHMSDFLRLIYDHPSVEIVEICDDELRHIQEVIGSFSIAKIVFAGKPGENFDKVSTALRESCFALAANAMDPETVNR